MDNNKETHLAKISKIFDAANLIGIHLGDINIVQYEYNGEKYDNYYIVITVYGGLNGHGNWMLYMHQIQELLSKFNDAYIIEIKSKPINDTWMLKFSIRSYE